MTHLTMTPFISHLRVYAVADGYAKRIPYEGILTVVHLSDSWVYVAGAVGKINRASWNAAIAVLLAQGVTTMQYERHGYMKTRKISDVGNV